MKLHLLLALAVSLGGATLLATAEPAAACAPEACAPPECVEWRYWFHVDTIFGPVNVPRPVVTCVR